jgi:hypothetical protein
MPRRRLPNPDRLHAQERQWAELYRWVARRARRRGSKRPARAAACESVHDCGGVAGIAMSACRARAASQIGPMLGGPSVTALR